MSLIKINWQPTTAELRKFGLVLIVGFIFIGLIRFAFNRGAINFADNEFGWIFIFAGIILGAVSATGLKLAMPIYWLWMVFAFVMGNIMSRVFLTLIFFLVVTPLGFLGKIIGRDKLQLKKTARNSYWNDISLPDDAEKYKRQF